MRHIYLSSFLCHPIFGQFHSRVSRQSFVRVIPRRRNLRTVSVLPNIWPPMPHLHRCWSKAFVPHRHFGTTPMPLTRPIGPHKHRPQPSYALTSSYLQCAIDSSRSACILHPSHFLHACPFPSPFPSMTGILYSTSL